MKSFCSFAESHLAVVAFICLVSQGCAIKNVSQRIDPIYPPELSKKDCQMTMIKAINAGVSGGCSVSGKKSSLNVIEPVNQPTMTADQKQQLRNQYIDQIVISINSNYRRFKDSYYIGQASFDTFSDFALLTLNGITAVAGGAATKAALGAAAAGVTGAHSSVQKNFFENNARDALFTIMDSLRQSQLGKLDQNKQLNLVQYQMPDALRDLDLYYEMGTILKAQQAIYSAAGSAQPAAVVPNQAGAPIISTQPTNQTVVQGQTATLSLAASGAAPLTYQWYQGAPGDTSSLVAGGTSSTLTTPALVTAASYWARVTNSVGHADSNGATVTVNNAGAPVINTQPTNQIISSGQTATLSVTAIGAAPLTYQWYQGASGDISAVVAGATNNTFTTPALLTGTSYWVRVINSVGHADSNGAGVTVTPNQAGGPAISTQPTNQTVVQGQTATLSLAASGAAPLTYQWYQGAPGDTSSLMAGETSNTLTTGTAANYWARVTNSVGHADSNGATVTVNNAGAPVINTQPTNQIISSGQTATLSVTAIGAAPLTYQWYQGASGDISAVVAGATNNTFTTPALLTGTSYWVRVTNSVGHADSSGATIKILTQSSVSSSKTVNVTDVQQSALSEVAAKLSKTIQAKAYSAAR